MTLGWPCGLKGRESQARAGLFVGTSNPFALTGVAFGLLAMGIAVVQKCLRPIAERIAASGKSCRMPAHGFDETPIDLERSPKPIGD